MSKLIVFMSDGTTIDVPLARERTTIGRRADNDICLPDLAVSGEHAVVVTILADSFLEDLGSTNGTLVNGKAIAKHFLRDRDQVEIGRHKIVYLVDDDATMTSEIVGLARISARDFGERVEAAKPFARPPKVQVPAPSEGKDMPSAAPVPVANDAAIAVSQAPKVRVNPPAPAAVAEEAPSAPLTALPEAVALASIRVLSGANAGAVIPLTKAETTIGRPGVQVAAIVRAGDLFLLTRIEGGLPLTLNDMPVAGEGATLAPGDIIAIADTRIEFLVPGAAPKQSSGQA